MKLVDKGISIEELKKIAETTFGNLVKAVVDTEKEMMVIDAELHADQEQYLIKKGSNQENLWGINIYPDLKGDQRFEFDSMINLRPAQNNMSRGVEDEKVRAKIIKIVNSLITE